MKAIITSLLLTVLVAPAAFAGNKIPKCTDEFLTEYNWMNKKMSNKIFLEMGFKHLYQQTGDPKELEIAAEARAEAKVICDEFLAQVDFDSCKLPKEKLTKKAEIFERADLAQSCANLGPVSSKY